MPLLHQPEHYTLVPTSKVKSLVPSIFFDPWIGTALFHEAGVNTPDAGGLQNASLRRLDQSWRLAADNRNEVIVAGRVPVVTKPAEELMTDPLSPSPSVLWLKGLPGDGPRVPTPGTLQQETFVRSYVPIPPVK